MNRTEDPARYLIAPAYVVGIYVLGLLVTQAAPIFLWLVVSFFIFTMLDRPAQFLKRHRWPVALSAILLTFAATVVIGTAIFLFSKLLLAMASDLEQSKNVFADLLEKANDHWTYLNGQISALQPTHEATTPGVSKVEVVESSPLGGALGGTILHGVSNVLSVLTFALLVPILSFFFLAERPSLACWIRKSFAKPEDASSAWDAIVASTIAFFFGNLVLGLVTYPLFAAILWAFGTPSVITLAGVAAVLNLIPFAGAALAGLFPALMLFTSTQTVLAPLAVYGCCFAVHLLAADVVTPKVLGSKVDLNATTSTVAMVVWGELWGGIGLVLAIPLMSIIKILFEHSEYAHLHWLAGLMSAAADEELEV